MFFKKKRRMIDVRELQKRGVVRIPKDDIVIPTNQDGFVELGNDKKLNQNPQSSSTSPSSNTEFFGFMDSSADSTSPDSTPSEFSTESDGYNKREVDEKITDLDNKIYKLENRIELLEKKLNINQSSDTPVGVMGW